MFSPYHYTLEKEHSWFLGTKNRLIKLQTDQVPCLVWFHIPSGCEGPYFTISIATDIVSLRISSIPTLKAQTLKKNGNLGDKFPNLMKSNCDKPPMSKNPKPKTQLSTLEVHRSSGKSSLSSAKISKY